jgi:aryl-alcohol dehydrogenase-like predicted oxidoreductase
MSLFEGRYARFMTERSLKAAELYAEIAAEAGMTPAQMAYAFCRSQWFIP